MLAVFLETLPFFALIGLGYFAGRTGFFPEVANAYLTKFVFYFALSAMLFRFSATLAFEDIFDWPYVQIYLTGTFAVWILAFIFALVRAAPIDEAAVEAHSAVIGNVGFLGIPLLIILFGDAAIGTLMLALAVDLIVFGSLGVVLITVSRDGRKSFAVINTVVKGLITNPMIMSVTLGLLWSALELPIPTPLEDFVVTLGSAATPCALFAIGASLASKTAARLSVAIWISVCKHVLHPLAIVFAIINWPTAISTFSASVMIACAAMPVAGNVYIIAQHYRVAPTRVSASILVSTLISSLTVSAAIAWVKTF